jgi:predicted Zn-dependent protease
MRERFDSIAGDLEALRHPTEAFTCHFCGEESDFIRLNGGRIRQAGSVHQAYLTIDWIEDRRHASGTVTISGDRAGDRERLRSMIERLREQRGHLPEDPHLFFPAEVRSTERIERGSLPDPAEAIDVIEDATGDADLVGLYACGPIHAGFADSRGQRNWHTVGTYHFDWSLYVEEDRAVKGGHTGTHWSPTDLARRIASARRATEAMRRPAVAVPPDGYRVYLSPEAVCEILGVLSWGGFGLRAAKTKTTPLLRMIEGDARLHPAIDLSENVIGGIAPAFQESGFLRPERVSLIERGVYRDCLVSPRSSAEYGVPCNGASRFEAPESIDMAAGELPVSEVLERLGDGIWIGNLHYLNYSDRPAARITGLTRFATFRVRGGEIEGPLRVMRFDDTIYRIFGESLSALTRERERIFDPGTYERRSTDSALVPGAIVEDFRLTL